ncbi:MAG TPA: YdcF family protein [Methylomirabilota bacterium]|nr:YdcF family protein [Methylomirabilota bacterium]
MSGPGPLRALGVAGLALFVIVAFTPLPNVVGARLGSPPALAPADAIVVLGSGTESDGTLANTSLRRTVHAIRLYQRGLAPLLFFLGARRPGAQTGEAEVRAALARELAVPATAILTEEPAWTTREEASRAQARLAPRGVRTILLVSEARHLVRARPVFERAGFRVLTAPADGAPLETQPEARLWLTRELLAELVARTYYRLAGYL